MISEKDFSNGFSSFWTECLPLLTPQVIARFNLNGMRTYEFGGQTG